MKIIDLKANDVVCSTDGRGTGYYRVLKVCPIKVRVRGENGNVFLSYPHNFARKITYPVNV